MEIKSNGIRITDICDPIPMIEVDDEGSARILFRSGTTGVITTSAVLEHADLKSLREAIDYIETNWGPVVVIP